MGMFAIEMKYIFTGKLELSAGTSEDIGPVEMELIFAIGFFLLGFLGTDGMTRSITEHFSFIPDSLSWIKLNDVISVIVLLAIFQFVFENLIVSFRINFLKSIKFLISPLALIAICAVSIYLG
jgi:hypothetical protein